MVCPRESKIREGQTVIGNRFKGLVVLAAGLAMLAGCNVGQSDDAATRAIADAAKTGKEWLTYGGSYDEQRYSQLGAITKDNVEAQLMKALSEVPAGLQKKPIKVGVASNIAIAYSFLLISKAITNGLASNSNSGSDAATEIKFGKFTLVELPGLPDNHMVIAEPKNVVFGTGLKADFNNVHVVNTNETLLDGKVRGSLVYNAGVEYYNSEEIVWYRPATPSV